MPRSSNKSLDFLKYKEKWGLANYCFNATYNDRVVVTPIGDKISYTNGEIKTVHNLMKRRNNKFTLREKMGLDTIDFDNLQELLSYMLIKKIAL